VSHAGGTRLVPLSLPGPAGALEALLQERDGAPATLAALVCHPHPLYGGTLHNKVVHRVAATLHGLGATVLRFNFRGVGKSEGRFDEGDGELEDARAMRAELARRCPGAHVWLAGFSFGSWIAARLAASDGTIERLVLVAPPVSTQDFTAMHACAVPKLVVQGDADTICPPAALDREWPRWAEPKQRVDVAGASHFFDRQLAPLGDALAAALAAHVPARPA